METENCEARGRLKQQQDNPEIFHKVITCEHRNHKKFRDQSFIQKIKRVEPALDPRLKAPLRQKIKRDQSFIQKIKRVHGPATGPRYHKSSRILFAKQGGKKVQQRDGAVACGLACGETPRCTEGRWCRQMRGSSTMALQAA